jgi:GNAT superfamily N-acetyltransferase
MYMKIVISEEQLNKIVENIKNTPKERKTFDFFDLVSKGILWVVEPHENGERVEPNWEHDTNLITLWNVEHPEPGQEWVRKAKYFTKTGSIKWWNEVGQFELSDEKYNQILRSIELYKEKNKKDDSAKFLKCKACKKWFTQTIHKKKKSLPICPWCGKHNMDLREDELDERSRSFAFTRKMRLFSKAEMMANPMRYKNSELKKRDIDEIGVYKFSERSNAGVPGVKDYEEVMNNGTIFKEVNGFVYLYDIDEDDYNSTTVKIYIVDKEKKEQVGVAEFEMRGTDFYVSLPYVRQEYRRKGIGLEVYKIMLTFGGLVSGRAQSEQAVALWKTMYKVLPNKMVFIDDDGKEHDVELINNDLVYGDEKESVYKDRGGYLKLYQNK